MTTPLHSPPTWWRSNKWGVILLIPALLAAVASASFRLVNLYLPWTYTTAHAPTDFHQVYAVDGKEEHVRVSVTAIEVSKLKDTGTETSFPNAQPWRVTLGFTAPPESSLSSGCTLVLHDAAGREFTPLGALSATGSWGPTAHCTPLDDPRPGSWQVTLLFVTPRDAQPDWLQLGWYTPDYIRLPLR